MATYTIDRTTWARGFNELENVMYRKTGPDTFQSVHGQVASQMSFSNQQLNGQENPVDLLQSMGGDPEDPGFTQPQRDFFAMFNLGEDLMKNFGRRVMRFNDDPIYDDATREIELINTFRENGHGLAFIN